MVVVVVAAVADVVAVVFVAVVVFVLVFVLVVCDRLIHVAFDEAVVSSAPCT